MKAQSDCRRVLKRWKAKERRSSTGMQNSASGGGGMVREWRASSSALVLPWIPLWPGIQIMVTEGLCKAELKRRLIS